MTKEEWISAAEAKLEPYMKDASREYAESLYETYVVEDDPEWSPEDAVNEDISCWNA
jgi:hypothetical protein